MAKKFYLIVSSLFVFFNICVMGTSCNSIHKNNPNIMANNKETVSIDSFAKITEFNPDTLINNALALQNRISSERFFPGITSKQLMYLGGESPAIIFSSMNDKEYLIAFQYEGGTENEFSCFEIGYSNLIEENNHKFSTNYKSFELESGLKLGLSVEELIKIKGNDFVKENGRIIYRLDDYKNSSFLKKYNMPVYFLECSLENNRIVKIKFGFEYP